MLAIVNLRRSLILFDTARSATRPLKYDHEKPDAHYRCLQKSLSVLLKVRFFPYNKVKQRQIHALTGSNIFSGTTPTTSFTQVAAVSWRKNANFGSNFGVNVAALWRHFSFEPSVVLTTISRCYYARPGGVVETSSGPRLKVSSPLVCATDKDTDKGIFHLFVTFFVLQQSVRAALALHESFRGRWFSHSWSTSHHSEVGRRWSRTCRVVDVEHQYLPGVPIYHFQGLWDFLHHWSGLFTAVEARSWSQWRLTTAQTRLVA